MIALTVKLPSEAQAQDFAEYAEQEGLVGHIQAGEGKLDLEVAYAEGCFAIFEPTEDTDLNLLALVLDTLLEDFI